MEMAKYHKTTWRLTGLARYFDKRISLRKMPFIPFNPR